MARPVVRDLRARGAPERRLSSVGEAAPAIRALATRARVSDRYPVALRRYMARVASRASILLLSDLTAVLSSWLLLRSLMSRENPPHAFAWHFNTAGPLADPGRPGSTVLWLALLSGLLLTGLYTRNRVLNTSVRVAIAAAFAAGVAAIPLAAIVGVREAIVECSIVAATAAAAILLVRMAAELFLRYLWPGSRGAAAAILVGPPESLHSPVAAAIDRRGSDYRVVARVPTRRSEDPPHALARTVEDLMVAEHAEAVVLCDAVPEQYLAPLVDATLDAGGQVLYPPRAVRIEGLRPQLVWHHDRPFFLLGTPVLAPGAIVLKRLTDIVGALLLLTLATPAMLVVAIAIKLDSLGPVFFAQDRAGLRGRRFKMWKFRTMRLGADGEKADLAHLNRTGDVRLFKIESDPRVTRVGRFLRRLSLDELPQLWNVLDGTMSLVGPRPFFESDFAAYEDHHFRRLDTKAGITGLWQVGGRSEVVDFEDVVFLDRQYIEQWSFWLDLSILFRTIPAVLRRTGAF